MCIEVFEDLWNSDYINISENDRQMMRRFIQSMQVKFCVLASDRHRGSHFLCRNKSSQLVLNQVELISVGQGPLNTFSTGNTTSWLYCFLFQLCALHVSGTAGRRPDHQENREKDTGPVRQRWPGHLWLWRVGGQPPAAEETAHDKHQYAGPASWGQGEYSAGEEAGVFHEQCHCWQCAPNI